MKLADLFENPYDEGGDKLSYSEKKRTPPKFREKGKGKVNNPLHSWSPKKRENLKANTGGGPHPVTAPMGK